MIINCLILSYVIRLYLLRIKNIGEITKGEKMLTRTLKRLASTLTVFVAIFSSLALPQKVFGAETQYFPVASSRVGPYSAMGTGYYGAQIDYMNYVNMTGGVNGVMLTWQECETEYNAVKTLSLIHI